MYYLSLRFSLFLLEDCECVLVIPHDQVTYA